MHTNLVLLGLVLPLFSQPITPQSSDWNSTFCLAEEKIKYAGLDETTTNNINTAIRFERTNWAGGSIFDDHFYIPPANTSHLPPGTLLSVEEYTNTSLYTLPPSTALSRILFQSETFNGTTVPASAYILWPWVPREDPQRPGKFAVVGWGHGTSGTVRECAPSHIRNLWYQYSAPYILALQGYVVVAPDYAGLGVSSHADGRLIRHTYLSSAQGNDLIYAVQAAQEAFPELSERFVLMGHSQGGHAAWAAASRLAYVPVKGYLGAIAASPSTNTSLIVDTEPLAAPSTAFTIATGIDEIYPDFDPSEWFTDKGIKYLNLIRDLGACNSALSQLILQPDLVKPSYASSLYFTNYANLMANTGRLIAGPLLVLQGTADTAAPVETTETAVNKTCENYPDSQLEYATFEGVGHVPAMYASQRIWLDWIADRFAGKEVDQRCTRRHHGPARKEDAYQRELEYYLEYATQAYLVA